VDGAGKNRKLLGSRKVEIRLWRVVGGERLFIVGKTIVIDYQWKKWVRLSFRGCKHQIFSIY
jgi:hypothetical protein